MKQQINSSDKPVYYSVYKKIKELFTVRSLVINFRALVVCAILKLEYSIFYVNNFYCGKYLIKRINWGEL